MSTTTSIEARPRRLRWPLIAVIAALHLAGLYGLTLLLAPDLAASARREVVAAFAVTVTAPPDPPPPPPEARPEPDEGAAGAAGAKAVAAPVAAPTPRVRVRPDPARPRTASTGTASAADAGAGTGAAGNGEGTGSGRSGAGSGGGAVTRPVHISGRIDNARDFPVPPGGRSARRGTAVIVRVIIGPDGRARDCTIHRPSPDPEADRITCQLVEARLGFRPATNAEGQPVAAPFYWRQQWF